MQNPNRALRAFESYRVRVIPTDAPVVEIRECKRAFYAGVVACLAFSEDVSEGEGTTANDLLMMFQLQQELDQFNADVLAGAQ